MAQRHAVDYRSISVPYKQFCKKGSGVKNLKNARGLSIEPVSGSIYVVERGNSRVQVFSPEGEHLFFIYPRRPHRDLWGIHIDKGLVYVTDYHHGRVYLLTLNGDIVSEFGKGIDRMGNIINMVQPMGVAVDRKGDIYVCEFGAKQVIIFEEPFLNNHLYAFTYTSPHAVHFNGNGETCLITGDMMRYGKEPLSLERNQLSYTSISSPRATSWFGYFDTDGNILVSDIRGFKILIFETSRGYPRYVYSIKTTLLGCPMGIAVDRYGRIVCATNSRIYLFREQLDS